MRNKESIENFRNWLSGLKLAVNPTLHINHGYGAALVVVDFGTPKVPLNLSQEITGEVNARMRDLVYAISGKRNARVMPDHSSGIYWAGY